MVIYVNKNTGARFEVKAGSIMESVFILNPDYEVLKPRGKQKEDS